jgi:ADP-dependent NAD(P)H-hydrate dehydratase / NAD(P)H-hydrate epimerase
MSEPIVTIAQMQAIEHRLFAAGMPVAALMEKVGGLISRRFQQLFPLTSYPRVGVLFGAGHNGGDALVVARELHWCGYQVLLYSPSQQFKDLTSQHYQYITSLEIVTVSNVAEFQNCDVMLDGLFGFGLDRSLNTKLIDIVTAINQLNLPIVTIDLPSGIQADTGEILGAAIVASHTFCLGLWKMAFAQEAALAYLGNSELLSFDIPSADIQAVLGQKNTIQMMTKDIAHQYLPHHRSLVTHKYQQGHLLLIVGSEKYAGAAILAGLGARASGVGLLSIAVPHSLKLAVLHHLPDAIIIGCSETAQGVIAQLPELDWSRFTAIAVGCGLTIEPVEIIKLLLTKELPLILDADALNILAQLPSNSWQCRSAPTIITPHGGEWRRLFPDVTDTDQIDRIAKVISQAAQNKLIVLSKGARTIISDGDETWVINNGTPALARGGSGDVLTGLIGGTVASSQLSNEPKHILRTVASANWWHAQAGNQAAQARGIAGVDAFNLNNYLTSAIVN